MRGRVILRLLFLAMLGAAAAAPGVAQAQFSPRALLGVMTRPLRDMLGRVGHIPRFRRHVAAPEPHRAAPPPPLAQLGMVGPLAWPSAYADAIGYALWPGEDGEQFRARSFDVIAYTVTGHFDRATLRTSQAAHAATTGAAVTDSGPCDSPSPAPDNWPSARIEQTVQLDDAQRQALMKLQTAVANAVKAIKAGCRDTTSLPPTGRLNILVQRLWAVRDAGTSTRAALAVFYASLTDAQKAGFQIKPPADPRQSGNNASAASKQVQACAARVSDDASRLIKAIEDTVHPNKPQSAGLAALRKTSSDMARLLAASCVQPIPADPVARLDAADTRLTTMNYAATDMQIALNGFYAQLDAGQKARFDSLGR